MKGLGEEVTLISNEWNHGIMEGPGLGGTLKIIWFHPPALHGDTFH